MSTRTVHVVLTESDGATSNQPTKTINIVNAPPVISGFDSDVTYTENDPALILDADATITDFDSLNFANGKLTVQLIANANSLTDRIEIRNQGVGPGQIGVNGTNITYGGVLIGTSTGNTYNTAMTVYLNANANPISTQALLRNFTYRSISENLPSTDLTVRVALFDGDGGGISSQPTKVIHRVPVNDAPVLAGIGGTISYVENNVGLALDSDSMVSDVDSANLDTGTLTVQLASNAEETDRLSIQHIGTAVGQVGVAGANVTYGGVVVGSFTGGSGSTALVITFNAHATPLVVQTVLRKIRFHSLSENPSTATRTVHLTLTDGDGGTSAQATKLITVTRVNDV
ncbi:MAG: hypothetical protein FJ267_19675, partial [Planctomycetes bacterium]|nr:hypothetical protein [Planctomycetota bacterium]